MSRKAKPEIAPWWRALGLERNLIHARFVKFTRRLPPPLKEDALNIRTYLGRTAPPHRARRITDCIPVVTVLPYVFQSCFPVEPERLRTLSYALTLLGLYSMAEDKSIDSQIDPSLAQGLLATSLYVEFLNTLHELFPAGSDFWPYHDKFLREHQMAEIEDQKRTGITRRMRERKYCSIVKAKAAPLKLAVCGMSILSGRKEHMIQLMRSFDNWIIGYQLHDDVVDWREDYLACRESLIVGKIGRMVRSARHRYRSRDLAKAVYSSDVIESTLEESGRWFARAEKSAQGIGCDDWIHFVRDFAGITNTAIRDLVTLKVRILFGTE